MSEQKEEVTIKDEDRQPCEVFTRVMGYYRPKDCANIGKRGEFAQRVYFDEKKSLERADTYVHP